VTAAPDEKWGNIHAALCNGSRGLLGGSTLAQLLAEQRSVRNKGGLPNLTAQQILEWADAYHKKTGKWPKQKSGDVAGASGEKWNNVDTALSRGRRGLPGGSSLAQLIKSERNRGKNGLSTAPAAPAFQNSPSANPDSRALRLRS
jgi:hypothetical protein